MASVLFTRWFQSQVFTPGFRLPAQASAPDPWAAPAPTQRVLVDFIDLRRRLAPYVASTTATRSAAGDDEAAWLSSASPKDYTRAAGRLRGFAFGPDLWIKPLPANEDAPPPLALPADKLWIDFWTGAAYAGGQNLRLSTPLDRLPLFARAGAILPLTPPAEPSGTVGDTLELRVYPGADGRLALRVSASETISVEWNDHTRSLRIGARAGAVLPKPVARHFHVVLVRPGHGVGHRPHARPDQEIRYDGTEVCVQLPAAGDRPRPPVGLTARLQGDRLIFTWQHSSDGVIYRLKRTPGAFGPFEDVASSLVDPEYTIPLSESGPGLHYVVTAINGGGESPASASVQAPSPVAAPRPTATRPETLFLRVPDARLNPATLGAARRFPATIAASDSRTHAPKAA
jgi:hypothetical protein